MEREQTAAETKALNLVIVRLHRKFADVPLETIRAEVDRVHRRYDDSRVRGFLPILVEREVSESFAHHSVA